MKFAFFISLCIILPRIFKDGYMANKIETGDDTLGGQEQRPIAAKHLSPLENFSPPAEVAVPQTRRPASSKDAPDKGHSRSLEEIPVTAWRDERSRTARALDFVGADDWDDQHPLVQTAWGATLGSIGALGAGAMTIAINTFGAGGISAWVAASTATLGMSAAGVLAIPAVVIVGGTAFALWGGRQVVLGVKRMVRGY